MGGNGSFAGGAIAFADDGAGPVSVLNLARGLQAGSRSIRAIRTRNQRGSSSRLPLRAFMKKLAPDSALARRGDLYVFENAQWGTGQSLNLAVRSFVEAVFLSVRPGPLPSGQIAVGVTQSSTRFLRSDFGLASPS